MSDENVKDPQGSPTGIDPMLPRWKCHKVVGAAQILQVLGMPNGGVELRLTCGSKTVSAEWAVKHDPKVGGYYVEYAGGYSSYSPPKEFVEGYSLLGMPTETLEKLASEADAVDDGVAEEHYGGCPSPVGTEKDLRAACVTAETVEKLQEGARKKAAVDEFHEVADELKGFAGRPFFDANAIANAILADPTRCPKRDRATEIFGRLFEAAPLTEQMVRDAVRELRKVPPQPFLLFNDPRQSRDPWKHRSAGMSCATCMWCVPKEGGVRALGRCRRHAPTMNGYPVVYPSDWCGDHKLDENK